MSRLPAIVLLAFSCAVAQPTAHAQTPSTWNSTSGNWTDTARWSTANYPNNGNGGVNYTATIGGGNVSLNQNITINGLTLTGGSIVAPVAGGPFTLTALNSLSWTGGTFGAGQTLRSNGPATVNNPTLGGTFENAGNAAADNLNGVTGAVVSNLAGGTWTGSLSGNGTFNNLSGATYTSGVSRQFEWAFNNLAGGMVTASNATLQFRKPGAHSGAFVLNNSSLQYEIGASQVFGPGSSLTGNGDLTSFDALITVSGTYALRNTWIRGAGAALKVDSTFAATGQLRIDPGALVTLQKATTLNNFWLNGGTITSPNQLTFTGPLAWEISGTLAGTGSLPHRNQGIITLNYAGTKTVAHSLLNESGASMRFLGGDMHIAPGATLVNSVGATFQHQTNTDIGRPGEPNGAFQNSGTFSRLNATGTTTIYSQFHNATGALVEVQSGTLNLANPGKLAGTFNVFSGATLAFSGVQSLPGTMNLTGAGTIAAAGGVTTIAGTLTYPNFALTGGTLGGSGTLNVGALTISGGTIGRNLDLSASAANSFTGGTLTIGAGYKVNVTAGATLQAAAGTIAGGGNLNNAGTINKSGAGTLIIAAPFRNLPGGHVAIQSGSVQLNNPGTLSGFYDLVGAGTTLALAGDSTIGSQATFTGSGIVQASAGTITISGAATIPNFTFSGGTLAGAGTLTTGNLVLSGGTIGRDFSLGGTVSNQFTGGVLTIGSGFTLSNPSGFTLAATSGRIDGPGTLSNSGTLSKTGTSTLTLSAPFFNAAGGLVQIQAGTLSLVRGGSQDGAFAVSSGAILSLNSAINIGASSAISGMGQVRVSGPGVVIAGAGQHTYSGGTVINGGGEVLATGAAAAFGVADVTVNSLGILRLTAAGNIAAGTKAVITSAATMVLEGEFDPAPVVHTSSTGLIAVNRPAFSTPLNQAAIGNGNMFLGSTGNGTYSAATLGAGSLQLYRLGGGGGTLTLSGTNMLTGANAVTIGPAGSTGTVVIASANNYTLSTTVQAGALVVGHNQSLGTGQLSLNGGTFQAGAPGIVLPNAISIGGNPTFGGTQDITFAGNITLTGNRTLAVSTGVTATLSGNIGGDIAARSLTKSGPGTLVLSGSNTYSGGTTVAEGTLRTSGTNQSLGLGNVTIAGGAALRQASFNNLSAGAVVAVQSGGVLGLDGNFPPNVDALAGGMIAINSTMYSQALNMAAQGAGQIFLGSQTTGQYNAATLGAGAGSVYRLGGGGGTLTIPTANLLTGFNGLVVGSTQVQGAGTVVLAAGQSYQGNTTINSGSTLIVQGFLSSPGAMNVQGGATLAGAGPVSGTIAVGGTLSPGSAVGTMTANNGVTFASGSRYSWDLAALTTGGAGSNWDQVNITGGVLNIDSAATLVPGFSGTATPPNVNDPFWHSAPELTWRIVALSGSATGTGGLTFQIDNSAWLQFGQFSTRPVNGGVDLVWTHAPEPVHILLIAAGAAAIRIVRRRTVTAGS